MSASGSGHWLLPRDAPTLSPVEEPGWYKGALPGRHQELAHRAVIFVP